MRLHGVRIDLDFDGHRAERGQRVAGAIHASRDGGANLVGDLQVDRYVAARIDLHAGTLLHYRTSAVSQFSKIPKPTQEAERGRTRFCGSPLVSLGPLRLPVNAACRRCGIGISDGTRTCNLRSRWPRSGYATATGRHVDALGLLGRHGAVGAHPNPLRSHRPHSLTMRDSRTTGDGRWRDAIALLS